MASTNKTQYFELSQYISTDKPTYLVDYNGDMLKIDGGLHTATQKANEATSHIGDLTTLTTTNKSSLVGAVNELDDDIETNATNINTNTTNISTINSKIGTITDLTTTDKSSLVGAINEVDGGVSELTTKTTNMGAYSSDEKLIGTWVDGKPLYRKVITSSSLNFGNWTQINVTNMNIYNVKKYQGIFHRSNQRVDEFAVGVNTNEALLIMSTRSFGIELWCDSVFSDGFQFADFIIEYTKSTD